MTRQRLIVGLIVGLAVTAGVAYFEGLSRPSVRKLETTEAAASKPSATPRLLSTEQIPRKSLSREQIGAEVSRRDGIDGKWEWKIPIRFYGMAVDEKGQPVADVDVHFQWTDLSAKGTSVADSKSDARGHFALENVKGKSLLVRLTKPGYYATDTRNRVSFEYANPFERSFHEAYADAPVVFYLRKQSPSPDVISKSTEVMLHGDTAVEVGLETGRPAKNGELVIEASKPWPPRPMSPSYDWKVGFRILGGGFVDAPDQFAFEAPEDGYVPDYTVDMKASLGSGWKVNAERTVYFVFGKPRKYGRLTFRTDGNSRYVFLDYVINRAGGRNLEAPVAK